MQRVSSCPNCEGGNLYRAIKPISSGGGYAPNLLPGLSPWYTSGRFEVVVCRDCGLARLFADEDSRKRLGDSDKWERV